MDGNQRPALTAVRSLGKKGKQVAVGEDTLPCLSSVSKYFSYGFCYPSPYINPAGFIQTIHEVSAQNSGVLFFPMTDVTLSEVLKNKAYLSSYVKISFPDYGKYSVAYDKVKLFHLAKDLNISIPKTLFSADFKRQDDLISAAHQLGFLPAVKPARSRIRTLNGWMNTNVRYAKNLNELKKLLGDKPFHGYPFLIQEKVENPGVGIFVLMNKSSIIARFAHQRIREKPPSRGVNVLCQSIQYPS